MLLKNTTTITLSPPKVEHLDVRIENGKISDTKSSLDPKRGEEVIDIACKILMPGFVNAHTHLYSSLSRGMPPPQETPQNFLEILQKIWWKLDRALDDEAIYYSALVGVIDAARYGTTTLVDHHASPKAIKGSLEIIKEALSEVGLRGVLCYEVTDRGGRKERDQGLQENERFIRKHRTNPQFRGLVGAHASFTLSNDSLRLCGELATKYRTGVHIHLAEDVCDVLDAEESYTCNVVDRLEKYDILKKQSILAHCVHVKNFSKIHKAQSWLVHNPRSNMNNRIGYAPVHQFGKRAALGTDGFPADMFEETHIGYIKQQEAGLSSQFDLMTNYIHNGHQMVSEIFGREFWTLRKGSVADVVILDYISPTPLTDENLLSHFLFGMKSSMVESVMVGGKWISWEREILGVDVHSVYEKASRVAKKLWNRMYQE